MNFSRDQRNLFKVFHKHYLVQLIEQPILRFPNFNFTNLRCCKVFLFFVCKELKSRSSKNSGLDKSDLHQISNFGREFVEKSGVQIPVKEGQIFLPLFLFIFKFSIKNCISLFLTIFEYLVLQIRYQ